MAIVEPGRQEERRHQVRPGQCGLYAYLRVNFHGSYECIGPDFVKVIDGQVERKQENGPSLLRVEALCAGSYECIINMVNRVIRVAIIVCDLNKISKGGSDSECEPCPAGSYPSSQKDRCIFPFIEEEIKRMKEDQNDLSIKNSRLWAKEEIRMKHDDMMAKRKERDNKKERNFCKEEEEDGTVVFPAIDVPNEIENIEDTTCIDTNRDELLKAFCSFRHDLDDLFKIQGRKETAESFFPNICCKERRDTKLEVCEDPSSKIPKGRHHPVRVVTGGTTAGTTCTQR